MCHDLEKIILALSTTILQKTTGENGQVAESKICNPDFVLWKKDQTLIASITATLSKEVLHTIFKVIYAKVLWDVFATNYS